MNNILHNENIMEERFVVFLDILGFSETVKNIEQNNSENNLELKKIKSILNFMNEEATEPNYSTDLPIYVESEEGYAEGMVEQELGDPRLTYVSDCIIISAEPTLDGFKALSKKIHKITADLAYDGVFCRGAITKGKLFHRDKVLFGSSYIRAYELEKNEAIYPRVIIDPDILGFFDLTDGKMPLAPAFFGKDNNGMYYQRYWTWFLFPQYCGQWDHYLLVVRHQIIENLEKFDDEEHIREKYLWLKDEFNSLIDSWRVFDLKEIEPISDKVSTKS